MNDFCIYILTHRGDFLHAKLLCQSIRYFCGDVPIVILRDGDFSIDQLKKLGNVTEFDTNSIPTALHHLRGSFKRLGIFFNKRFDRFLYLDADTVLISNILDVSFLTYDFYVDATQDDVRDPRTKAIVTKLLFDVDKLALYDPKFNFEGLTTFNAGQFFGRSGMIPLDTVLTCYEHIRSARGNEQIFKYWEQGMLNYIFNKGRQEGWFSFGGSKIAITPSWEPPEKYPTLNLHTLLSKQYNERFVIHFTTPVRKQLLRNYPYGYILSEFYKQYYANFPIHIRYLDELERLPRLIYRSSYNFARNIRNQVRKVN